MAGHFQQALIAGERGLHIKQAKTFDAFRRAFHALHIMHGLAQHLETAANAQNLAAAPDMRGQINVPALRPEVF